LPAESEKNRLEILKNSLNLDTLEGVQLNCTPDLFLETLFNSVKNDTISHQAFIKKTKRKKVTDLKNKIENLKKQLQGVVDGGPPADAGTGNGAGNGGGAGGADPNIFPDLAPVQGPDTTAGQDPSTEEKETRYRTLFELEKELNAICDQEMRLDLEKYRHYDLIHSEKMTPRFLSLVETEKKRFRLIKYVSRTVPIFRTKNRVQNIYVTFFKKFTRPQFRTTLCAIIA
jgi:hypothetical protein